MSLPAAAAVLAAMVWLAVAGDGLVRVIGVHAGAAFLLAFLRVVATVAWLRSGSLDFVVGGGGITFRPPPRLDSAIELAAGCVLASTAWVYADGSLTADQTAWRMRGLALVVTAGLVMIAVTLAGLRHPAGLRLTTAGLRGARGGPQFQLPWDCLTAVDVSEAGSQRTVRLFAGQDVHAVQERLLGSDAFAVVAVVDYFRAHPGDRTLLERGSAAIQRVEEEHAARRRR